MDTQSFQTGMKTQNKVGRSCKAWFKSYEKFSLEKRKPKVGKIEKGHWAGQISIRFVAPKTKKKTTVVVSTVPSTTARTLGSWVRIPLATSEHSRVFTSFLPSTLMCAVYRSLIGLIFSSTVLSNVRKRSSFHTLTLSFIRLEGSILAPEFYI
jgi:hypothetical protein